jgi:hypothetical protein
MSFVTNESEEERQQLQLLTLAIIDSKSRRESLPSLTASIDKIKLLKAAEPASKLTLVQVLSFPVQVCLGHWPWTAEMLRRQLKMRYTIALNAACVP